MFLKKELIYVIGSFFIILEMCSCTPKDHSKSITDNPKKEEIKVEDWAKEKVPEVKLEDTIVLEDFYYPGDSLDLIKVLMVGNFHNEEVNPEDVTEKWLGLFEGKDGFYIDDTDISIKPTFDVIVDENDAKTGWAVRTLHKDSCLLLIAQNEYMNPKMVIKDSLQRNVINAGEILSNNYLHHSYLFSADGVKNKDQYSGDFYNNYNYKLYLQTEINGNQRKSLLSAQPNFDDEVIDIIFAGDLDGDGILDLIIDNSRHYNMSLPTLYLSKPAKDNEAVIPVGSFTSIGC